MANKNTKSTKVEETTTVVIPNMIRENVHVPIVGTSSLIVHQFSDKVKATILNKQLGTANKGREKRDPISDFVNSLHFLNGANREDIIDKLHKDKVQIGSDVASYFKEIPLGFPASGFKKAAVGACRNVEGIPMTLARGAFFINEDSSGMVKINYDQLIFRQDTVRLSGRNGVTDLRFRGEFRNWKALLSVELNPRALSADQVFNLIDVSGFSVGVGEWRPEKDGSNGRFMVERG